MKVVEKERLLFKEGRRRGSENKRVTGWKSFDDFTTNVPVGRSEEKSKEFILKEITCIRSHLKHRLSEGQTGVSTFLEPC